MMGVGRTVLMDTETPMSQQAGARADSELVPERIYTMNGSGVREEPGRWSGAGLANRFEKPL